MLLGGFAIVTLFTLKATFLLLVALAVGWAMWEVSRAFAERDIAVSVIPAGPAERPWSRSPTGPACRPPWPRSSSA